MHSPLRRYLCSAGVGGTPENPPAPRDSGEEHAGGKPRPGRAGGAFGFTCPTWLCRLARSLTPIAKWTAFPTRPGVSGETAASSVSPRSLGGGTGGSLPPGLGDACLQPRLDLAPVFCVFESEPRGSSGEAAPLPRSGASGCGLLLGRLPMALLGACTHASAGSGASREGAALNA